MSSAQIDEAYRRLEQIEDEHRAKMFDEAPEDAVGVLSQSQDSLIVDICERLKETLPEQEPKPVRRYRALVLAMDTVRRSDEVPRTYDDPINPMQNVSIELRDRATDIIKNRLVLESPTDEEDADVIYIFDPVSKVRHTTALGGYKKEYDEAMIEGQKTRLAEQILTEPIPDTVPRV